MVDFASGAIDSERVGDGLVFYINETRVVDIDLHRRSSATSGAASIHHDHGELQKGVGLVHFFVEVHGVIEYGDWWTVI